MKFILKEIFNSLTISSLLLNLVSNTFVESSEITSPELDSTWLAGNSCPIEWNNLDSNSIQIQLGVQTNLSVDEWKFEDESGHDYLSVMYDSRLNYYDWNIPLTMIHLWEHPLKIFIKEIDINTYVQSQPFRIAGITIESPINNGTFLEYDTIPIRWSFNSMFNSFNISLCSSSINIYNINISKCEYVILEDYQPNTLETNLGEITYNWVVPEILDAHKNYKILISSLNNTIMMLSNSFFIHNNPSTTQTSTQISTQTSTLSTITLIPIVTTSSNNLNHDIDETFPIYIPLLSIFGAILLLGLLIYCISNCINNKKTKITPIGREYYNNNYESSSNNNLNNQEKKSNKLNNIENDIYDESFENMNSRIITNNTYHETSFGGYGIYYNHLSPSGNFLPDKNGNPYNHLDRNNTLQDKIRKTNHKDEPNIKLIRAINQEIHNNKPIINSTDMDSKTTTFYK